MLGEVPSGPRSAEGCGDRLEDEARAGQGRVSDPVPGLSWSSQGASLEKHRDRESDLGYPDFGR